MWTQKCFWSDVDGCVRVSLSGIVEFALLLICAQIRGQSNTDCQQYSMLNECIVECCSHPRDACSVPCTNCITGVLLLVSRLERTRAK